MDRGSLEDFVDVKDKKKGPVLLLVAHRAL